MARCPVIPTTRYRQVTAPRSERSVPCPGCGLALPEGAVFCVECGACLLSDLRSPGTDAVISELESWPEGTPAPGLTEPHAPVEPGRVIIELDLEDLDAESFECREAPAELVVELGPKDLQHEGATPETLPCAATSRASTAQTSTVPTRRRPAVPRRMPWPTVPPARGGRNRRVPT